MKTLSGESERVREVGLWVSGADDVARLEPLGALQQIELHGFALIQRTITILLNRGEMNEDILPSGPLDKSVSLGPVEPLYCTLLSHNELLSPLLRLNNSTFFAKRARTYPLKACGQKSLGPADIEELPLTPERLLSFAPRGEKAAQSSGACRGGDSFDYNPQNINPNQSTLLPTFRQRQE
jgi:hypothetical protein